MGFRRVSPLMRMTSHEGWACFGEDVELARKALSAAGCEDIIESKKECSLTFPLEHMDAVCDLVRADGSPIEPQVVYFVYEVDDDGGFFIDVAIEDAF